MTLDERYAAGVEVDVEGFERLVLEGAQRALELRRIGMLRIEWNDLCVAALGETRQPIARLLRDAGYSAQRPIGTDVGGEDYGRDAFAVPVGSGRRWPGPGLTASGTGPCS